MTDIVTSPIGTLPTVAVDGSGLFSPGAATVLKQNCDIINATWNLAKDKSDAFAAKIAALTADATGWLALHPVSTVSAGSITAPTPTEPSMTISDVNTSTVFNNFATEVGVVVNDLVTKFSGFQSTWFPTEAQAYGAAESYVTAAITNVTASALPSAIKASIIATAKAAITDDKTRAIGDALDEWVSKRHQLPPGALTYQTMRIEQKAQDGIVAAAREAQIKDFDMTYDKIMTSVKLALTNRTTAMQAAQEYVKTVVAGDGVGAQIVGTAHSAQVAMIEAAKGFFGARIAAANLAFDATRANQTLALDASKANQESSLRQIENQLKVFLAEAQALATMATALLNNLRAGGSASYNVSI